MARKTYSKEFRRDAVELYRSSSGGTVVGIAADPGIMDSTLSAWQKAAGVAVRGASPQGAHSPEAARAGCVLHHELDRVPAVVVSLPWLRDAHRLDVATVADTLAKTSRYQSRTGRLTTSCRRRF